MTAEVAIPLTVIGGYLGSGKTTLLNGLLRGDHGRRLAVLVNDFGSINIDADLITAHDGDTISLANGCICCGLQDDLGVTLYGLTMRRDPPDQIVIEASGVADPARIGHYAKSLAGLHLDAVIVVVDAERIRRQACDKYVGDVVLQQLSAADLLVLTKTDLVTPQTVCEVRRWLENQAPAARTVEVISGNAPPEILLGPRREQVAHGRAGEHLGQTGGEEHHEEIFSQVTYASDRPFERAALVATINGLPAGVVRAKGILYLADAPAKQFVLQLVGRRWELQEGVAWEGSTRLSRLVLIGPRNPLDGESISASFDACLVEN